MVKKVERWITEDGVEFNTENEAVRHEEAKKGADRFNDLYIKLNNELHEKSDIPIALNKDQFNRVLNWWAANAESLVEFSFDGTKKLIDLPCSSEVKEVEGWIKRSGGTCNAQGCNSSTMTPSSDFCISHSQPQNTSSGFSVKCSAPGCQSTINKGSHFCVKHSMSVRNELEGGTCKEDLILSKYDLDRIQLRNLTRLHHYMSYRDIDNVDDALLVGTVTDALLAMSKWVGHEKYKVLGSRIEVIPADEFNPAAAFFRFTVDYQGEEPFAVNDLVRERWGQNERFKDDKED